MRFCSALLLWILGLLALTSGALGRPPEAEPDGKKVARLRFERLIEHALDFSEAAISADSKSLVIVGDLLEGGKRVVYAQLWALNEGKKRYQAVLPKLSGTIRSIKFLPDGRLAAFACGDKVAILDTKTGKLSRTLSLPTWSRTLSLSPDGMLLAVGAADGKVHLWDTGSWRALLSFPVPKGEDADVWDAAFSPDGKRFAVMLHSAKIHLWDCVGWKQVREIDTAIKAPDILHDFFCFGIQFMPDSRSLAAIVRQIHRMTEVDDFKVPARGVRLLDAGSGKEAGTFGLQRTGCLSTAITPDGRWGISAGEESGSPLIGLLTVTDLKTGKVVDRQSCFREAIPGKMILAPDGRTLIVLRNDSKDTAGPEHLLVWKLQIKDR